MKCSLQFAPFLSRNVLKTVILKVFSIVLCEDNYAF